MGRRDGSGSPFPSPLPARARPEAAPRLHYLGHATVLVEVDGLRVLTDPVLRSRVGGLRRTIVAVPARQVAAVDLVLISHGHHDHLDVPSLRLLSRTATIVVPTGLKEFLTGHGFTRVVELTAGASMRMGPAAITATEAVHDGRRARGPHADPVGYLLRTRSRTVYFAGDTDLFPAMDGIGASGLDVALLPVAGWGPRLGPGHLDPGRAAEAVARLRPRVAVPIHWGTYTPLGAGWLMRRQLHEPPVAFAAAVAARQLDTHVAVTSPGGRVRAAGWSSAP